MISLHLPKSQVIARDIADISGC